jgi:hypothetical protein
VIDSNGDQLVISVAIFQTTEDDDRAVIFLLVKECGGTPWPKCSLRR